MIVLIFVILLGSGLLNLVGFGNAKIQNLLKNGILRKFKMQKKHKKWDQTWSERLRFQTWSEISSLLSFPFKTNSIFSVVTQAAVITQHRVQLWQFL